MKITTDYFYNVVDDVLDLAGCYRITEKHDYIPKTIKFKRYDGRLLLSLRKYILIKIKLTLIYNIQLSGIKFYFNTFTLKFNYD